MAEPIIINFQLDWREYFAATETLRANRYTIAPEKVVGGLLITSGAAWFFIDNLNLLTIPIFTFGLAIIFGARPLRQFVTRLKWAGEPFYRSNATFTFVDQEIHFIIGRVESRLDWKYYQGFLETPDSFIFVYAKKAISLFPKRAFADDRQIAEFRNLVHKKLERVGDDNTRV